MMTGKMWNNNRLPSLLFGIDYFLSIIVLQDPLNRPINSLWIMNITEAVTKNEACHTINHGTVETIFFLHLIFLFECIVNRIHHRNSPDTEIGSIAELEKQLAAKSVLAKNARNSLVETEHQLKDLGQILKYAEQYQSNHIYHVRYQKSKNPDAYLRSHETELLLHDGAENMLKRLGMNPKTLDIDKLRNEYNSLYSKKETLQKTYKSAEKEINALNRKLDNLNQYLNRSSSVQQTNDRKMEKDKTTR